MLCLGRTPGQEIYLGNDVVMTLMGVLVQHVVVVGETLYPAHGPPRYGLWSVRGRGASHKVMIPEGMIDVGVTEVRPGPQLVKFWFDGNDGIEVVRSEKDEAEGTSRSRQHGLTRTHRMSILSELTRGDRFGPHAEVPRQGD